MAQLRLSVEGSRQPAIGWFCELAALLQFTLPLIIKLYARTQDVEYITNGACTASLHRRPSCKHYVDS
jgi:hypothetical protein